jgi:hypothetical protein
MTTSGYGTGYGTHYGGGGGIPASAVSPFDVFCFDHCVTMFNILTDPSVSTVGSPLHFTPNGVTCDLDMESGTGAPVPDLDADLIVTQPVPNTWTLEWTAIFHNLPTDFTDVVNRHLFVGATDAAGPCAGLFVSKVGLMYLGAIHHVAGNLVVDSTTQVIPGSALYISEGEYITIRMSVSGLTGAVYLFVTKTADIPITGQVLRAVLPTIDASVLAFPATDRAIISVRGDVVQPTFMGLDQFCMSSSVLIPNLKPVANAGADQASRACAIIQLDGSASFDPEEAPLSYLWRLIDTPLGSSFAIEGGDGFTKAGVGGFTDLFFSNDPLGVIDVLDPILAGDVLLVDGTAHTIIGTGIDAGPDFFVQIGSSILPELVTGQQFKVLRQRGLSNPTTVNPTFFPDEPGFYKFDLTVNDGALSSDPSVTIVNVLESPLPRGCTPDLSFLFNYLSDFWNLVEDRDRISVFWGSLAQIAATELFTLWQYEYSKSHRDIQRTFIRRWLHYDLMLAEPIPELTNIRAFFGGVTSSGFLSTGLSGINGTTLVISSPTLDSDVSFVIGAADPVTAQVLATELQSKLQNAADDRFTTHVIEDRSPVAAIGTIGTVVPGSYAEGQTFTLNDGSNPPVTFEIDFDSIVVPGNVVVDLAAAVTADDVRDVIIAAVLGATINITPSIGGAGLVALVNDEAGVGGNQVILTAGGIPGTFTGMSGGSGGDLVRIDAPFPFTVAVGTTLPPFTAGDEGQTPFGTGGAGVGQKTYKVPISLEELDIQEDDFLVLDGFAHRISTILDDPGDQFPYQRIVVKQVLPTAPVASWALSGWVSSELLDFYNGLVALGDHIDFEVAEISDENAPTLARRDIVETVILGVNDELPSRAAFDAWPIGDEIADDTLSVLLARVVRRTYVPRSELVVDIPTLQELIVIEDDEETLRRNVDFFLEEVRGGFGVRFASGQTGDPGDVWEGERPPNRLWAEYTYLDNRPLIEANFGLAVELTVDQLDELPENIDYLSAVRGLWYAFYNGPTIRNLRIGSQILLGLPFAETQGTITEIRTDFSPSEGRILIQDTENEEIIRSYNFPRALALEVNPATGVQYVVDDVVEEFAPLVEGAEVIDYLTDPRWFEGILNQGIFYEIEKFHKFVVRVDKAAFNLSALLFVRNFVLKIKPTYTFPLFLVLQEIGDTEVSTVDEIDPRGILKLYDLPCENNFGMAPMYDQGRPAGGGWRNQFDSDVDPDNADPTFPTAEVVSWAYDKAYTCPLDDALALRVVTFGAPTVITFDTVFAFGTPIQELHQWETFYIGPTVVPVAGTTITLQKGGTASFNGTVVQLRFSMQGDPGVDPTDWQVVLQSDAGGPFANIAVENFTMGFNTEIVRTLSIAVTAGDNFKVLVRPASGAGSRTPNLFRIRVQVLQQDVATWNFGDPLPAGTYALETPL